jgi:hypothetical protein
VQQRSAAVGYALNLPKVNRNAWQDFAFIDVVLLLAAVAALAAALVPAGGAQAALGRNLWRAAAGLGSLSVLLVLFRLIDPPENGAPRLGAFIGLIAAGAVSVGAYFVLQERGILAADGTVPRRPTARRRPSRRTPSRKASA